MPAQPTTSVPFHSMFANHPAARGNRAAGNASIGGSSTLSQQHVRAQSSGGSEPLLPLKHKATAEASQSQPGVRSRTFKRSAASKHIRPIAKLSQDIYTAEEVRKFSTMYLEHQARGGKISFEAMAKEWNSDLLTEIGMRPDSRTALFSTMTMKCAAHLKRFHTKLVDRMDNTISCLSVSAQPRLAQTTLLALATHQSGIDWSG
jgi:hypothetical protein